MVSTSKRGSYSLLATVLSLPVVLAIPLSGAGLAEDAALRVGVFTVDASPPIGSPVAYVPARTIEDPLSARGIVLLGAEKPIVLCAVDWIGISNGGGHHGCDEAALAHAVARLYDKGMNPLP